MDEERLSEIQHDYINLNLNEDITEDERAALARKVLESHRELIEEVHRLQAPLARQRDTADAGH